jgi:hypothetical protein
MTQSTIIAMHRSTQRDDWWFLEQDEDGSLHVSYESDDDHTTDYRVPLHEFIAAKSGAIQTELQFLINRMFEERPKVPQI